MTTKMSLRIRKKKTQIKPTAGLRPRVTMGRRPPGPLGPCAPSEEPGCTPPRAVEKVRWPGAERGGRLTAGPRAAPRLPEHRGWSFPGSRARRASILESAFPGKVPGVEDSAVLSACSLEEPVNTRVSSRPAEDAHLPGSGPRAVDRAQPGRGAPLTVARRPQWELPVAAGSSLAPRQVALESQPANI